jgi:hypothetical protein
LRPGTDPDAFRVDWVTQKHLGRARKRPALFFDLPFSDRSSRTPPV